MKITSPPEKWKKGDYFILLSLPISDWTHWNLGKALYVGKSGHADEANGVTYDVVFGKKGPFPQSYFDFSSISFKENKIFRVEDDKKRAFDIIFKKALK